tara:strand:- start:1029 stop:2081 length:1053 start_codon:yes stop_codon:yes gene_type:complete
MSDDLLFNQDLYTYNDEILGDVVVGDRQGAEAMGALHTNAAAYADPSDAYANARQIVISFYSMIGGDNIGSLNFKAFVTSIADNFTCDWNEQQVFGRNDPIYNFKHTKRNISLAFQVVAASRYEAVANMERLQTLIKMLYPAYKDPYDVVSSLTKSPLIKLKFANLIADHSDPGGGAFSTVRGGSANAREGGLVGVIKSLNITPNFESGVYDGPGPATIYPKLIEVSLEFGVIHQATLGFDSDSNRWLSSEQGHSDFPYGVDVNNYQESIDGTTRDLFDRIMLEEASEVADAEVAAALEAVEEAAAALAEIGVAASSDESTEADVAEEAAVSAEAAAALMDLASAGIGVL